MDYTVHEILQARMLEWVAISFSRGLTRGQFTLLCRRNWHNIVKQTTLKENKEGAGDLPLCLPLGSRKRARAHTQICGCHKPGREAPPETSRAGSLISAAQPLSTVRKNAAVFGLWFLAAPAKAAEKSLRAVGGRPAGSGWLALSPLLLLLQGGPRGPWLPAAKPAPGEGWAPVPRGQRGSRGEGAGAERTRAGPPSPRGSGRRLISSSAPLALTWAIASSVSCVRAEPAPRLPQGTTRAEHRAGSVTGAQEIFSECLDKWNMILSERSPVTACYVFDKKK